MADIVYLNNENVKKRNLNKVNMDNENSNNENAKNGNIYNGNPNNANINNGNMIYDELNNDNLNEDLNSTFDLDMEKGQEEKELSDGTEDAKPRKTPLEHLEKVLSIAAGLFFAFADFSDHLIYFYFIAAILFLVSGNILSLWNKAIKRGTHLSLHFKIYFYLRTLVGIIIAICAYDICLTEHYDTSAYWIIFYSVFLLLLIEGIDEITDEYRKKILQGKTRAILSCIRLFIIHIILYGVLFCLVGPAFYLKEKSVVVEHIDSPTVDFVYEIGKISSDIKVYNSEQTGVEEEGLLLLIRELNGKKLERLKWDQMMNYVKMLKKSKPYYKIYLRPQNASDCILYQGMTYIYINRDQAVLVVDKKGYDLPWYYKKAELYELKLSNETMNMLQNYLNNLKE